MTALVDPRDAFLAQDPTVLAGNPSAIPAPHTPRDRNEVEIAAAVVAALLLVRRALASREPVVGKTREQARAAWAEAAPTWLRIAEPAIRQAYALGRVEGLTADEMDALSTHYASQLGEYINESSADALAAGMEAQIAQRWSAPLAWHRATAAYGLDQVQMRGYIQGLLHEQKDVARAELIPAAARAAVDRALLARATRLGQEESYSASQSGLALSWIYLERTGQLAAGHQRMWELGENEQHCATCAELAGQLVPLAEPFVFVSGAKIWAPRAHPRCHCRLRLIPPEIGKGIGPISKAEATVAGLVLVAKDTGRVLMIQRARDPKDPASGMWEFPGGHLDPGETPQAAAEREYAEEVRSRAPAGRYIGMWRSGIYQGFAKQVASESLVPTHRRGRVRNPDDPGRHEIEAIAWWDLDHVWSNPAVRKELRESWRDVRDAIRVTSVAKADGRDPFDRDARGHFASRESRGTTFAEPPAATKPVSPFDPAPTFKPSAFKPTFHATFQPSVNPFTAPTSFVTHQPFVRPRNLSRRVVVVIPKARAKAAASTYWLPADNYHALADTFAIGSHYKVGEGVDFDIAASRPWAEVGEPWQMLSDDYVLSPDRIGTMTDPQEVRDLWDDKILPKARLAFNVAMTDAGDAYIPGIVDDLGTHDITAIYRLAGMPNWASEGKSRQLIKEAVENADTGQDDSLAMAYGDYVTWTDPGKFLGSTGRDLEQELDAAEQGGIKVRDFVGNDPFGVEQVFAVEQLHPGTNHDRETAALHGEYVVKRHQYRSALHDLRDGHPALRFGMRESLIEPFVESDSPGAGH